MRNAMRKMHNFFSETFMTHQEHDSFAYSCTFQLVSEREKKKIDKSELKIKVFTS